MKNNKKTINRKRIIARIIALCAMLGVIIALALPCFAVDFEVPEPPIDEAPIDPPDISDNTALSEKQNMFIASLAPDYSDNDCAYFLSDYYWRESATLPGVGLFQFNSFISGKMVNFGNYRCTFSNTHLYELATQQENYSYQEKYYLDSFCFELTEFTDGIKTYVTGSRRSGSDGNVHLPYAGFSFYYTYATDSVEVKLEFRDSVQNGSGLYDRVEIYFTGYFDRDSEKNNLVLDYDYVSYVSGDEVDALYGDDASSIAYAFVPRITNYPTLYYDSLISLISANSPYGYRYCVYNPTDFYYGYENGFEVGVDIAYGRGWNAGYDIGYTDGYTEAYNAGYNRGVGEISSGDFGRNLLGGLFSAPMQALSDFTIVEWQTANGTFTLSLATVLSAIIGLSVFVWFLKTFAGG